MDRFPDPAQASMARDDAPGQEPAVLPSADAAMPFCPPWACKVLDTALSGLYVRDLAAGVIVFVNAECVRLTGYTLEQFNALGPDGFMGLFHHEDRQRVLDHWLALKNVADGQAVSIEYRFRRSDGRWIWCLSRDTVLERDADGSVRCIAGTFLDISEQRATLAALRESESRFRTMTDELPLIIWVHDAQGQLEFVNRAFCEYFGVSRDEMHGDRWQALIHPEDAPSSIQAFVDCAREHRPFHNEARVRRADGEWRLMESWARLRTASDGSFLGFVGASVDITERKTADDALRLSEERLRLVAIASGDGIYDWNLDTGSIWWNEAYRGHLHVAAGGSAPSLDAWAQQIHPEDRGRVVASLDRACRGSASDWSDEYRFQRPDGVYVYVLDRCHLARDASGRAIRGVGTMVDLTERKRLEDRLQEANRRKDEFLATLAHELRNPLAPIQAGLDAMQVSNRDPSVAERALPRMQRQMSLVVRLVDDLMDLSRITRGKITLQTQRVDVRDIIRQALETSVSAHASSRRTLRVDLWEHALFVDADPIRLLQIVGNLLDNAAKYTHHGGTIWLKAARQGDEAVITVRDDGKGIRPDMLEVVFDMFAQANTARGSGLGIGLTLAQHLARLHGGSIEARSDGPGRGSTFIVRLPLIPSTDRPSPLCGDTAVGQTAVRHRVLVVDDNPDVAESFGILLDVLGAEVCVVHDGPAALAAIDEFRPQVAFIDIGMPGMDGCEVSRRIRADAATGGMVLVALTGWSHDDVRRRIADAGFDHHLVKPASLEVVQQILQERGGGAGP